MLEPQPFPDEVRLLIEEHRRLAGPGCDCPKCDAGCCETGGLAVFENAVRACAMYSKGWLSRQFEPGLEDREFLLKYFDIVQVTPADSGETGPLQVFFPRSLVDNRMLICISPVEDHSGAARALTLREYLSVREFHREQSAPRPWTCVFRSTDIPTGDGSGRTFTGCLLHSEPSATRLTAKPIGCVLGVCRTPPGLVEPEPGFARRWLAALSRHYGRPQSPAGAGP